MVDLDPGELRHRITISDVSHVTDGEGGFTMSLATSSTVWARVKPMRAKQKHEYRSINVEATHLVKVRGGVDVQEEQIITFGTREFEVLTVENEMEENVTKWVMCKEIRS